MWKCPPHNARARGVFRFSSRDVGTGGRHCSAPQPRTIDFSRAGALSRRASFSAPTNVNNGRAERNEERKVLVFRHDDPPYRVNNTHTHTDSFRRIVSCKRSPRAKRRPNDVELRQPRRRRCRRPAVDARKPADSQTRGPQRTPSGEYTRILLRTVVTVRVGVTVKGGYDAGLGRYSVDPELRSSLRSIVDDRRTRPGRTLENSRERTVPSTRRRLYLGARSIVRVFRARGHPFVLFFRHASRSCRRTTTATYRRSGRGVPYNNGPKRIRGARRPFNDEKMAIVESTRSRHDREH